MSDLPSNQATAILMVEDNPGDVNLLRRALGNQRNLTLYVVNDGAAAIAFLKQEGTYAQIPRPDLILLDLNLPKVDGRQVLMVAKNDPSLRSIPIVILSGSTTQSDINQAYDLYANCYIAKPIDLDDYERVIRDVERFWLQVAHLPGNETP